MATVFNPVDWKMLLQAQATMAIKNYARTLDGAVKFKKEVYDGMVKKVSKIHDTEDKLISKRFQLDLVASVNDVCYEWYGDIWNIVIV